MASSRSLMSLVKQSAPQRFLRFYPPHYPPPQDVAAIMPYWMYPHLDETQLAIQEKAKGDWKELTDDERIRLYRAYHPVTFAEMQYPPSYGYQVFGAFFWTIAAAFPIFWLIKKFLLNPAPFQLHPDYMNMLEDRLDAVHNHPVWGKSDKYYVEGELQPRKEGEW